MPKYEVDLADGRTLAIHSATEDLAMKQAGHQETTRIVIATKREKHATEPPASYPVQIRKVKD
jgi:hypothetical protein